MQGEPYFIGAVEAKQGGEPDASQGQPEGTSNHIIVVFEGMKWATKEAVGRIFVKTPTLRGVTVVRREIPHPVWGFKV